MAEPIKRFDVFLMDLSPTIGHEIRKARPCLVVSPVDMNYGRIIIIAPMTTKRKELPTRIPTFFLGTDGDIVTDQVRAIDTRRIIKHLGSLPYETGFKVLRVLRSIFQE